LQDGAESGQAPSVPDCAHTSGEHRDASTLQFPGQRAPREETADGRRKASIEVGGEFNELTLGTAQIEGTDEEQDPRAHW
jgi:hypothetical protein